MALIGAATPALAQPALDLGLGMSHAGDFPAGGGGVYTLVVRNFGTADFPGTITVVDSLPPGLDFDSVNGAGWNSSLSLNPRVVTLTYAATIAAGDSASTDFIVLVGAAAAPSTINRARLLDGNDQDPSNDAAQDTTLVTGGVDVALDVQHPGDFTAGQIGSYSFVVTSLGTIPTAGAVTVTDTLPAGIHFLAASSPGWNAVSTRGIVNARYAASLAPSESATFTMSVSVDSAAVPQVVNAATARTPDDLMPANDRDLDTTRVIGVPDLALSKTHLGDFTQGSTGTYSFGVTNVGGAPTVGRTVVLDTLHAGLTFVSGAGAGWSISASNGVMSATHRNAIADTSGFTVDVQVGAAAVPGFTNFATVTNASDANPANNRAADVTQVGGLADVALSKRHFAPFSVGAVGSYLFTVRNVGPVPVAGVTVRDTLPAGLGYLTAAGDGFTFDFTGGVLTANLATSIPAGDSVLFVLGVNVTPAALPEVVNTATAAAPGDIDPANDRAVDSTQVHGTPDLALIKRHLGTFVVGHLGVYELLVKNVGAGATTDSITMQDPLPAGLTFLESHGAGWNARLEGTTVVATFGGVLAPNAATVESLVVAVDASAIPGVTNFASVSTPGDVNPSNDQADDQTIVSGVPDLALSKHHEQGFAPGGSGDYRLTVQNLGTAPAVNAITVTDTLPAGLAFSSASGADWNVTANGAVVTASFQGGAITESDSSAFTLTVGVAPGVTGGVVNQARVHMVGDGNAANDAAQDPTAFLAFDLALAKRHSGSFTVGATGSYALVVRNVGTLAAPGPIAVIDSLPAGLAFVSGAGSGWSFAAQGGLVTATHAGPLAAGDSLVAGLTVAIAPAALPRVRNTARLSGTSDFDAANDTTSDVAAVGGQPDLAVDLSHVGAFTLGGTGTYACVVRNLGVAPTHDIVVATDSLPPGLSFASASGTGWTFTTAGNLVTGVFSPLLAPGQSASFTMVVHVGAAALPAVTDSILVQTLDESDYNNNSDQDFTIVSGIPDLALALRHLGNFEVGQSASYRMVVRNVGTAISQGAIAVRDTLPAGLTFTGADDGGGAWSIANSGSVVTASFTGLTIPDGDSAAFTIQVAVGAAALPRVRNAATVTNASDRNPANNRAIDDAVVHGIGQLALSIAARAQAAEIGDLVDFAVTLRDPGTGPVSGVVVQLDLAPGLRVAPGSARRDGTAISDPAGIAGGHPSFALGSLAAGATTTLTYRARVGAGADRGDGVTRASASGDGGAGPASVHSNAAAATLAIQGGVFGDEGVIVGKVVMMSGCDSCATQAAEDLGIPGVRVYLEDGSFAITDVEGKYHFNHVRPRPHVVRIDSSSLPAGARLAAFTTRHAGDGLSQFVDLAQGELHRADFSEVSGAPEVRDQVLARRARGEVRDPADPGTGHGGAAAAETRAPRSLLVLGLVDAGTEWRNTRALDLDGRRDGFFDPRHDFAFHSDDGRLFGGARAAFYATGGAPFDVRFAVRWDSEQAPGKQLFRDLDPLQGYQALGDASVHGWDAQSSSRLYLRLDRGASSAMFGDFQTPAEPARQLSAFTRSLNGGIAEVVAGPLAVGGFDSKGHQHQVVDEFPALGISGPYALSHPDGVLGSETVELLTRDRNLPARVLRREMLLRFVDYTLEPFTGRLVFTHPIAGLDPDLDPVTIRVSYESEAGGSAFGVYGAHARWTPLAELALGATLSRDEDPLAPLAVGGATAVWSPWSGVEASAEYARSDSAGTGLGGGLTHGQAARGEIAVNRPGLTARIHGVRTGTGFENPSSGITPGRQELGAEARARLIEGTSVFLTALHSEDLATQGHLDGAEGGIAQILAERYTAEVAYRWAKEDAPGSGTLAPVPNQTSSVRGKLSAELPTRFKSSVFAEYEQDLQDADQKRYAVGGEAALPLHTRLYARHENLASLVGPFQLNSGQRQAQTVIGLASGAGPDPHVFSEYRMRDAFGGREAQAAIGLRNRWTVARGVRVDGAIERLSVLRGAGPGLAGGQTSTSVAGGLEVTRDPLWRGTARLEVHHATTIQNWLASAGLTRKLDRDWSALGSSQWLITPPEQRLEARSNVGLAFRQTDRNQWNALARYENRFEKAVTPIALRHVSHVLSANANAVPWLPWTFSGQLAAKWTTDDQDGLASTLQGQLAALRARYDLTRRWDVGVTARGLRAAGDRYGMGLELGWVAIKDLRLAGGYNVFGFRDEDLTGIGRSDPGAYFDVGWKFDETTLRRLGGHAEQTP